MIVNFDYSGRCFLTEKGTAAFVFYLQCVQILCRNF